MVSDCCSQLYNVQKLSNGWLNSLWKKARRGTLSSNCRCNKEDLKLTALKSKCSMWTKFCYHSWMGIAVVLSAYATVVWLWVGVARGLRKCVAGLLVDKTRSGGVAKFVDEQKPWITPSVTLQRLEQLVEQSDLWVTVIVCLIVCSSLFVCPSVSACLAVSPSVHLLVSLWVCLSIYLFVFDCPNFYACLSMDLTEYPNMYM